MDCCRFMPRSATIIAGLFGVFLLSFGCASDPSAKPAGPPAFPVKEGSAQPKPVPTVQGLPGRAQSGDLGGPGAESGGRNHKNLRAARPASGGGSANPENGPAEAGGGRPQSGGGAKVQAGDDETEPPRSGKEE